MPESVQLPVTVARLRRGQSALLDRIDTSHDAAERLMELGLVPGCRILLEGRGPGGSCLCRVDGGCVLALRRETAERLEVLPTV